MLDFKDVIATYTRLMLMFMLYVVAAARSTVFVEDSFNRIYSVYDTSVTTILKVFMKMLHLHSIDCICLSVVVNIPHGNPWTARLGWLGWVGVWDRKIEDVQYVPLDSR